MSDKKIQFPDEDFEIPNGANGNAVSMRIGALKKENEELKAQLADKVGTVERVLAEERAAIADWIDGLVVGSLGSGARKLIVDYIRARGGKWEREKEIRKALWLNHGCSGAALYGDDGELQCNNCMLDFRRMDRDELVLAVMEKVKARLAKLTTALEDIRESSAREVVLHFDDGDITVGERIQKALSWRDR